MLAFSELFQWNAAADFIADHLNYELLEPAHELVSQMLELFLDSSFIRIAENTLVTNEGSR